LSSFLLLLLHAAASSPPPHAPPTLPGPLLYPPPAAMAGVAPPQPLGRASRRGGALLHGARGRLHPVSIVDPSSFLLSLPTAPPPRPQATSPIALSSLLQMWREIEHRRADADHPSTVSPPWTSRLRAQGCVASPTVGHYVKNWL
jgi:hypothetical protein